MECLELNVLALVSQGVHDDLQILNAGDIPGHDSVVAPVEQYLAEELEGLTFSHVIWRENKRFVCCKELRIMKSVTKHV